MKCQGSGSVCLSDLRWRGTASRPSVARWFCKSSFLQPAELRREASQPSNSENSSRVIFAPSSGPDAGGGGGGGPHAGGGGLPTSPMQGGGGGPLWLVIQLRHLIFRGTKTGRELTLALNPKPYVSFHFLFHYPQMTPLDPLYNP